MNETPDYIEMYEKFMDSFKRGEVKGDEVGELIARMGSHYARYNIRLKNALRAFTLVKRDVANTVDEQTGKSITSTKAEVIAAATTESAQYEEARAHVQNIEQYLNALKALQRGVINEYAHSV